MRISLKRPLVLSALLSLVAVALVFYNSWLSVLLGIACIIAISVFAILRTPIKYIVIFFLVLLVIISMHYTANRISFLHSVLKRVTKRIAFVLP